MDFGAGKMFADRFEIIEKLFERKPSNYDPVYRCVVKVLDTQRRDPLPKRKIREHGEMFFDVPDDDTTNYSHEPAKYYALKIATKNSAVIEEIDFLKTCTSKKQEDKHTCKHTCMRILGCFVCDNYICIIFPFYKLTLNTYLTQTKPRSKTVINLAKSLIASINYVHSNCNIIHADIKPANIMLYKQTTCITDFGLSSSQPDDYLIQTVCYRSPEVILGLSWDKPSDIWSLGCVLYELVTRDILFDETNELKLLNMIIKVTEDKIPQHMIEQSKNTCKYGKFFVDNKLKKKKTYIGPQLNNIDNNSLRELAKKCLKIDPAKRSTIAEIIEYPLVYD